MSTQTTSARVVTVSSPPLPTPPGGGDGDVRLPVVPDPARRDPARSVVPRLASPTPGWTHWGRRAVVWAVLLVVAMGIVVYPIGPLFESRAQLSLSDDLRLAVGEAYGAAHDSLAGAAPDTRAPLAGTAVALLQIPRLAQQQAVAEGAGPSELRGGVGHVPGTAGVGQPGNAVLVGRSHAFAGPFGELGAVKVGDQILCLTTQGQSVYVVTDVSRRAVGDTLYDPTADDRLTLVTSDSILPWNSSSAVVVSAVLKGAPFVPTPQNGYAAATDGRHGDASAWALLVLELLALAAGVVGAVLAYRRWSRRMAYLVSTPPLVALVVFAALTGSRLLPGWV